MHIRALVSARAYAELFDLRCVVREALSKLVRNSQPELPRERVMQRDERARAVAIEDRHAKAVANGETAGS